MLLWFALGCSDYGFEDTPRARVPELVATLTPIDDGVCIDTSVEVAIQNTGDGVLTVSFLGVEGADWTLGPVAMPLVIAPGAVERLRLVGSGGTSTLVVRSDDPERREVQITLAAEANVAPLTLIVSPAEEQSVQVGADLTLSAFVEDVDDTLDSLALEWVSSLTGSLGTATPDGDGRVERTWTAGERAAGPQIITLGVRDPCGAVGDAAVFFCQDGPYEVNPIIEEAWHYEGAAALSGDVLTLTETTSESVGAAFDLVSVFDGDRVAIDFEFQIEGGPGGGEGVSVTMLDADRREGYIGGDGCGLGFGGGAACTSGPALPGWSLAIDTHTDPGDCLEGPHLAFAVDGDVNAFGPCASLPEVDDGAWHSVALSLEAGILNVSVDGLPVIAAGVESLSAFPGFLGFTASTSALPNAHRIRSVRVVDSTCE